MTQGHITLGQSLFPLSRQKLLSVLLLNPDRSFYKRELIRLTGLGVRSLLKELDVLTITDIIRKSTVGNQHHYQANPDCPIYPELVSIVKKTFGISDVLRSAIEPIAQSIDYAGVYGSVAKGNETPRSDIDVLIIGTVRLDDAYDAFHPAETALNREIHPKIYLPNEWKDLTAAPNPFIVSLLETPMLHIHGDSNVIGRPRRNQRPPRTGHPR